MSSKQTYTADFQAWMGDDPSSGDHWYDIMTSNGVELYTNEGMTLNEAIEHELPAFLDWLNTNGSDSTGIYPSRAAFEAESDDGGIYRFRGDVICKTPREMLAFVIGLAREASE